MADQQQLVEHLNETNPAEARWLAAGSRYQSFDVTFDDRLYEVKRLSVSKGGYIDRRFKVGRRSETIYGRQDGILKRASLNISEWRAATVYDRVWTAGSAVETDRLLEAIDRRKHGKKNLSMFRELCTVLSGVVDGCHEAAHSEVKNSQIAEGYQDIEGIFLLVDLGNQRLFTLLTKDGISGLLEFDSVSAEGVKLRYIGSLPQPTEREKERKDGID